VIANGTMGLSRSDPVQAPRRGRRLPRRAPQRRDRAVCLRRGPPSARPPRRDRSEGATSAGNGVPGSQALQKRPRSGV